MATGQLEEQSTANAQPEGEQSQALRQAAEAMGMRVVRSRANEGVTAIPNLHRKTEMGIRHHGDTFLDEEATQFHDFQTHGLK